VAIAVWVVLVGVIFLWSNPCSAAKRHILKEHDDKYIAEFPSGFVVFEWYGGSTPDVDDDVVGDFELYGFKDVYNVSQDSEFRVYIEDYWLDWEDALELMYD
jgi:hypothetical protein